MPIDYSQYPDNWKSEIVPRILRRAGNRCEKCGLENGRTVTSLALKIVENRKSKIKRFWLTDGGDIKRMEPFAVAGKTKEVKVILTVAHLDHDKENSEVSDDRLRAWCQYCHLGYDAAEKGRIMSQSKELNP